MFNISDPMHLVKKVVNAAWHSDIPDEPRNLGMWWLHPRSCELEFHHFSLKTLERVYKTEEEGGDDRRPEERLGDLAKYRRLVPEQFRRNSHNGMNVGLSAKVMSAPRHVRRVNANFTRFLLPLTAKMSPGERALDMTSGI